jgi:phage-related tail protein
MQTNQKADRFSPVDWAEYARNTEPRLPRKPMQTKTKTTTKRNKTSRLPEPGVKDYMRVIEGLSQREKDLLEANAEMAYHLEEGDKTAKEVRARLDYLRGRVRDLSAKLDQTTAALAAQAIHMSRVQAAQAEYARVVTGLLDELGEQEFAHQGGSTEDARQAFLRRRAAIRERVVAAFSLGTGEVPGNI